MGTASSYDPVRLVMGVLSTDEAAHPALFETLAGRFGPIAEVTESVPFSFTDYYDEEMGGRPKRFFVVFSRLVDPSSLARTKVDTNAIERQFAGTDGGRRINLDPGILSAGSFILATTKNRAHRIPLSLGMYAETTLLFRNKQFEALPWTYADYRSDAFRKLFSRFRGEYLLQLRKEAGR